MRLRVGHQPSQFWPILARLMDYYSLFWGPGVISRISAPSGAFTCRSSTLVVFSILTRLVDYYSPFWGLGVISTIDEPQRTLTCRSSTLAVLADSDPYLGLLLTVLGPRRDFHSC